MKIFFIYEFLPLFQVSGKLHVSLTKVYDGKNLLVSQFASKQEVIDVSVKYLGKLYYKAKT